MPITATLAASSKSKSTDAGAGSYETRHYPDLFAERLRRGAGEARAKVEQAFQQLFHGDGQEQRVYFETGANANGPLACDFRAIEHRER
jgi:oligosaccharide reducing-end xylanase